MAERWRALLLYSVLAIVTTWPVLPTIGSRLPGDGGDAYHGIWAVWWLAETVAGRADLFDCRSIFYPVGVSLANDSLSLANGIFSLPLQWLFGLAPAYSILFLLSFALGGWSLYLLARALGIGHGPALLAGIIFAWAPYHTAHSFGHLDLMPVHWLGFFFLALLRVLQGRGGLWPVWAGLFFTLAGLSAWYYLIYLALAAVTAWLVYLLIHRARARDGHWWRGCLLAVLTAGLLLAPVLGPVLQAWRQQGFIETPEAEWYSQHYSADLAALLTPPRYHLLAGRYFAPTYERFLANEVEGTVYLGWFALLLAWYGLWRGNQRWRFWAAGGAAAALVLAFGPVLQWYGRPLAPVLLPYHYLLKLPLFAHQQSASRAIVLTYLGLALLAAYGAELLAGRWRAARSPHVQAARRFLLPGLGALLLFDFVCFPYSTSAARIPAFYDRVAQEAKPCVLLELPDLSRSTWLYYQTRHRQPLINGYISRIPAESRRAADGVPLFRFLFNGELQRKLTSGEVSVVRAPDHIPQPRDLHTLRAYNVRYVILHPESDPQQYPALRAALRAIFNNDGIAMDGMQVFVVPPG